VKSQTGHKCYTHIGMNEKTTLEGAETFLLTPW